MPESSKAAALRESPGEIIRWILGEVTLGKQIPPGDLREAVEVLRDYINELERQLAELRGNHDALRLHAERATWELNTYRASRIISLYRQFRPVEDRSLGIAISLSAFEDDSAIFQDVTGFKVGPSALIDGGTQLAYAVELGRPGLSAVELVPVLDLPHTKGSILLHIFDAGSKLLVEKVLPLEGLVSNDLLKFEFEPLAESAGMLQFRVSANPGDLAIRILEWQRPERFGLKIRQKLFAAYSFS